MNPFIVLKAEMIEGLRVILRRYIKKVCATHPDAEQRRLDYVHFSTPKKHTEFGSHHTLHAEQHCLFLLEGDVPPANYSRVIDYVHLNGLASTDELADLLNPMENYVNSRGTRGKSAPPYTGRTGAVGVAPSTSTSPLPAGGEVQ